MGDEMSINLSEIRLSLQKFDEARWEYELKYMREEPLKKEALELQRCAEELARLLVWTEKEKPSSPFIEAANALGPEALMKSPPPITAWCGCEVPMGYRCPVHAAP